MATTQPEIKACSPLSTLARKQAATPSSRNHHLPPRPLLALLLLFGTASLLLLPSASASAAAPPSSPESSRNEETASAVAFSRSEGLSSESLLIQTKATVMSDRLSTSSADAISALPATAARGYSSLTWSMILSQLAMGALLAKCCQVWMGPGKGSSSSSAKQRSHSSHSSSRSSQASPSSPTLLQHRGLAALWPSSKGRSIGSSSSGSGVLLESSTSPASLATDALDRKVSTSSLPSASPTTSPSSSLLEAAHQNDLQRAQGLLARGARGDAADAWGCTALHVAAGRGNLEMIRLLIQADPALVHCREAWDETPLHVAARSGFVDALRELCSRGANLDSLNADDKTPLVLAAEAGHKAASEFLLDLGAGAGGMEDKDLPALLTVLLVQRAIQRCGTPASPPPFDLSE